MRRALFLVNPYFPTGVAISSRMLNFARLLRDAGWNVHVITGHHVDSTIEIGKIYEIEGISYQVTSNRKPSGIDSFVGNRSFIGALKSYFAENEADCVFMNATSELYRTVASICKKKKCHLYVEQCEWLDISNYRFGKADIRYINTQRLRATGFKDAAGIISISRLLNDYYNSIGIRTIRVPTILDVRNTQFSEIAGNLDRKVHIVFAGSLGGTKELMKPIIEALAEHDEFRDEIVFDVYGPTEKQIVKNLGDNSELLSKAGKSVVLHGRIPQDQISDVYAHSDYLIFVRPRRRSSNAGFPTKFAESMAVGTPVITNNTGDVGLFLKDGENGFMLSDNTTEAVCECFEKIIGINIDKYSQMRCFARKTAEENFDYRTYIDDVSQFFSR